MVQIHKIMEEDEDLEALRLAALQTIRARKDLRRPNVQRHLEKQSFCRHISNPNLIAIVPSEPNNVFESEQVNPLRNGIDEITSVRNKLNVKENEKLRLEKLPDKEKLRVRFRKTSSSELDVSKDAASDRDKNNSVGGETSSVGCSQELLNVDKTGNIKYDEDELDFEGDTVTLHDDDDSLDRLMDEMEQEFNQETLTSNNTSGNNKANKETKSSNKVSSSTAPSEMEIPKSMSSNIKGKSTLIQKSNTSKPQTPTSSPVRSSSPRSPTHSKFSPLFKKRYYSPSPPPVRRRSRSPFSPRLKRRRSHTPPQRKHSRSPVGSRNTISTKFNRARSPYLSKYNGRRTPESPRRRNSSFSPPRRGQIRNMGSPPRRKSPPSTAIVKRKSTSPVSLRHRRSPKRSPNRTGSQSQTAESKHRWRSPHHRKMVSQNKRELGSRNPKNSKRTSSPNLRITEENKHSRPEKKLSTHKEVTEKRQREEENKSQESLDSKFEARRRKFESSVFVNPSNKKIFLKNSVDNDSAVKNIIDKEDVDDTSPSNYRAEEASNSQISSTSTVSSKVSVDSPIKKVSKEIQTVRRVREMKRAMSPQLTTSSKKKTIILDESGQPQSVRVDVASLSSTNKYKSKVNRTAIKMSLDAEEDNSPKTEKSYLINENNDDDEEEFKGTQMVKRVLKKKKKNKELKRKRAIMLSESPENNNEVDADEQEKVKDKFKEKQVAVDSDVPVPINQNSNTTKPGLDLRAELSRRRAERLKGVTNPMVRIIQSAFEDVVANRKKFDSRFQAKVEPATSSGLVFKAKGNRRVHVLEESATKTSATHFKTSERNEITSEEEEEEEEDNDDFSGDDRASKNFNIISSNKRSSSLRTNSSERSGRSILRRSQV